MRREHITIYRDTREKPGLQTTGGHDVRLVTRGLSVCDYAMADDCYASATRATMAPRYGIEYKSREDFLLTLSIRANVRREARKLSKAAKLGFAVPYIVGATILDCRKTRRIRHGKLDMAVDWSLIVSRMQAWSDSKYGVRFVFCDGTREAARVGFGLLLGFAARDDAAGRYFCREDQCGVSDRVDRGCRAYRG